jgi:PKD repeat protein
MVRSVVVFAGMNLSLHLLIRLSALLAMLWVAAVPLTAAPAFSVPGFVDETLYQGNGMITMRFDPVGRLWVIEKQGRVLVFEPNPGGPTVLNYDYYETGQLSALPNYSTLTPVKSGVVNSFTLDPRQRDDDFAFRYTGTISIATAGSYTFYLSSDDGSRLFINDALVVNYDGTHGAGEMSGVINLPAGNHNIRVEYFERGGGQSLTVQYSGPGVSKGPVAQGVFKAPVVFADYSSQVNTQGERGMMGLALDPDFANTRYVYLLFATGTDQRLLRLTSNAAFTAAVAGSETILLSGLPNGNTVHKAGDIAFHPTDPNNLYIMLGDDGERYFVSDLTNYYGKLLKVSAADGKGLPTNPFYNGDLNSTRSRIWSYAYRNPYRFTFDPGAPVADVLYVSENGDGTDRLSRIEKGADGAWPTSNYLVSSADGKRKVLQTSDPAKTGVAIVRSGPFAPGGNPVIYNSRYGGGDRNEVRRWRLTGAGFDTLTPLPEDNGNAFYSAFTEHGIVSFTPGPDGSLYYTDSGQGASTGSTWRLGRIRYVGGTAPVAGFTANATSGQSPLTVNFTDTSTAPSSSITGRAWDFGDGSTSTQQNPSHTYTSPGVYTVSLVVTNAQGLTHEYEQTITVYHATTITLSGAIFDGRSLAASPLMVPTELRFYQADGVTPLPFVGGSGTSGNVLSIAAGGNILASISAQITGPGMVVSAGEAAADGMQPALVGIALSTSSASQSATANFYLSDTMLRGRVTDTKGAVARVDVGLSRGAQGAYYAFAGGRDFLAGSGIVPSGLKHRTVPDALGYYHMPIRTGGGGATFYLDTSKDTLAASHGRVNRSVAVGAGSDTIQNLTIGLYNGGTGEMDLSGIPETPNVNFNLQIQPIFSMNCVACHTELATNSGGLDLDPGDSYGELVDMQSTEAPGVKLVESGSPERSYLMEKINSTTPQVGTSMRLGDPMSPTDRALIRDWIRQLDTNPRVEFAAQVFTAAEGSTAQVIVRRTGSTTTAISVTASTVAGGSATAGVDYAVSSATLSWAANDASDKILSVPLLTDANQEENETVLLQLSAPNGATLGSQSTATLTILESPYDSWRTEKFGAEADDPAAQAGADYDHDGYSNLMEYGLNTDPKNPQTSGVPKVQPGPGGKLQISFSINPNATDLTYTVQARDALETGAWQTLATRSGGGSWNPAPGVSVNSESGVTITDSETIASKSRRFLRLRVEGVTE